MNIASYSLCRSSTAGARVRAAFGVRFVDTGDGDESFTLQNVESGRCVHTNAATAADNVGLVTEGATARTIVFQASRFRK